MLPGDPERHIRINTWRAAYIIKRQSTEITIIIGVLVSVIIIIYKKWPRRDTKTKEFS